MAFSLKAFSDGLFKRDRKGPSYPTLPAVSTDGESLIPGLYIKGDAAGNPLLKVGLNEGYDWVNDVADELKSLRNEEVLDYDIIIVGSGATGFAAATRAHELGLSYLVLESERFANIIQNFTKGKFLFAEPLSMEQRGNVWFEECSKEELLEKWIQQKNEIGLNLHEFEKVENVEGSKGHFTVSTSKGSYKSAMVLLAIGKSGNPRKANVPGEQDYPEKIFHFLADPDVYQDKKILIYGGGDVACEAALRLCDTNDVTMVTIDKKFVFPKKRNSDAIHAKAKEGKIDLYFDTWLKSIGKDNIIMDDKVHDKEVNKKNDVVFEMIGAIPPMGFFKKIGVEMEDTWTGNMYLAIVVAILGLLGLSYWAHGFSQESTTILHTIGGAGFWASLILMVYMGTKRNRWAWLSFTLVVSYVMYAAKGSTPHFPFHWIGKDIINEFMSTGFLGWFVPNAVATFKGAPSFWYSALYTFLVLYFGIKAMKRWGIDKKDSYQVKRFISIMAFQLIFFIVVNMVLSVVIGQYYWRGWGLYQPFPLFFNTYFWWYPGDPASIKYFFIGFGLLLTFIAIPILVRFHGLRFCTWVCGCGGLAETFGDTWRHLSPKGPKSRKWEFTGPLIVIWSFVSLAIVALAFNTDGNNMVWKSYDYIVDFWLVAVIPIGLYPFFGGKVWCRYWCPLAHYMKILSSWYGKLQISSNDKCISCTQCSKYCQVGVDVMAYAKNQQAFDNTNTSCIHCGICITVCPMDVLSFSDKTKVVMPESEVKML